MMLMSFVPHPHSCNLFNVVLGTSVFEVSIKEKKELSHFFMNTSRYHRRTKAYFS